ncbi:MAG: hypothetical protein ACRDD2_07350 [Sarcina sp.]
MNRLFNFRETKNKTNFTFIKEGDSLKKLSLKQRSIIIVMIVCLITASIEFLIFLHNENSQKKVYSPIPNSYIESLKLN